MRRFGAQCNNLPHNVIRVSDSRSVVSVALSAAGRARLVARHELVVAAEERAMTATPTTNATLPFRASGFRTLTQGLDYAAQGETGCNFFSVRGELAQVLPYRGLRSWPRRRPRFSSSSSPASMRA
jgi:hypothetical protein